MNPIDCLRAAERALIVLMRAARVLLVILAVMWLAAIRRFPEDTTALIAHAFFDLVGVVFVTMFIRILKREVDKDDHA